MVGKRFVRLQLISASGALRMVEEAGYGSQSQRASSRLARKQFLKIFRKTLGQLLTYRLQHGR